MAKSLYPQVNTPISLQEFIDYVDTTPIISALKHSDYKEIYFTEVASKLAQLALNKDFLTNHLRDELMAVDTFQNGNDFKPSTIILHTGNGYTIRAVIWAPLGQTHPPEIFSYFEPHDHNFDFFTIGYFGPGYTTRIYNYDYEKVKGFPGEEINLVFSEETNLTNGKVMYYFGSQDAHIQYPPDALTVSLNLILPKIYPAKRRQYEFALDEKNGTAKLIAGNIDRLAQQRTLLETAASLGDSSNLALIHDIALNHENEQLRAIAWICYLTSATATEADEQQALQDKSEYVRALIEHRNRIL